jgi:hypothetical protein
VGPSVIRTRRWVVAEPVAIVNRNPHFGGVPVVETVGTAIVLIAPKVLRIVDVRIMVEALPIRRVVRVAPSLAIRLLGVGRAGRRQNGEQRCGAHGEKDPTDHTIPPESNAEFVGGSQGRALSTAGVPA